MNYYLPLTQIVIEGWTYEDDKETKCVLNYFPEGMRNKWKQESKTVECLAGRASHENLLRYLWHAEGSQIRCGFLFQLVTELLKVLDY